MNIKRLLVIGSLLLAISIQTTFAIESTPSADIKAKLEELKKEIASKAAILKNEVDRKLKNKAYVGKVQSQSDQSLTLSTLKGPKVVNFNQDTVFESKIKSKTKFSVKTLSLENYIAALGDVDETGVLLAKKIILLPPASSEPKIFLWGQIISISDNLATLKDNSLKNISVSGIKNVKLNNFVILTGKLNKNNIFQTDFSYVLSGKSIQKIATPSAKIATPSGKVASPSAKPATKKSN